MTIADLSPREFAGLVKAARLNKEKLRRNGLPSVPDQKFAKESAEMLAGQTVAMMFSKRSTRTRVSTEAAVTMMGGHPMFLGKDDIQLGVCSFAILLSPFFFLPHRKSHIREGGAS
jgi:ornithine carbamoyltransferase